MKKINSIIFLIIIAIFSNSCIDIIDLDLDTTEPRIVIEAILDATDSTCTVTATFTNDFYDSTENEIVSNLDITLTKNNNEKIILTQNPEGKYFADNIIAEKNDEFRLSVIDSSGTEYLATAITPSYPRSVAIPGFGQIPFLTVFSQIPNENATYTDSLGNVKKIMFALVYWLDKPDEENYYRFKVYENSKYINDSYNFIDDQTSMSEDTMQMGLSSFFIEGDTVQVELLSINKATYEYFQQVMDVQFSGINSTTPYNPKGNFSNEALGYFCIQQSVMQEYVVMELPINP